MDLLNMLIEIPNLCKTLAALTHKLFFFTMRTNMVIKLAQWGQYLVAFMFEAMIESVVSFCVLIAHFELVYIKVTTIRDNSFKIKFIWFKIFSFNHFNFPIIFDSKLTYDLGNKSVRKHFI